MATLSIDQATFDRLQQRALQQGISVTDVVSRLLDDKVSEQPPLPEICILDAFPEPIAVLGLDLRYLRVNAAHCALVGMTAEALLGQLDSTISHSHPYPQRWKDGLEAVIRSHHPQRFNFVVPSDGVHHYETRVVPVFADNGTLAYVVGVTQDVTQHHELGNALKLAQTQLRDSEQIAQVGTWEADLRSSTVRWSQQIYELVGLVDYEPKAPFDDIASWISPAHRDEWQAAIARVITHKLPTQGEMSITRPDGQERYIRIQVKPVLDEHENVTHLSGTVVDITEKKRIEAALHQSERLYRTLVEHSVDAISLHHPDGRFLYINPAYVHYIGYSLEEMLSMDPSDLSMLVHPDDALRMWEQGHQKVLLGQRTGPLEYRLRRKNGSYVWVETNSAPIFDEQGHVVQIFASSRDVTDRHLVQEELRLREERYRLLADNVMDMIARHDAHGKFLYVTPSVESLLGYRPDQLIGFNGYELFHPEDRVLVEQSAYHLLYEAYNDETASLEIRLHHRDGYYVWFESFSRRVRDPRTGQPIEIISVSRDISQRKQFERVLRENERLLTAILRAVPSFIYIYDFAEQRCMFTNSAVTRLLGYSSEEFQLLRAKSLFALIHPDDWKSVRIAYAQLTASTSDPAALPAPLRVRHKDGSWRWMQNQGMVFRRDADGKVQQFLGVVIDIGERKQAELQLEQRERLLREAQALAHLGSWEIEISSYHTQWSDELFVLCGLQPQSLVPTPVQHVFVIHPADRAQAEAAMNALRKEGIPYKLELRLLRPDGSIRWVQSQGRVVAEEGGAEKLVGTLLDITERKEAEAAALEQERLLARLKKEQEFNTLVQKAVSVLSHDARTPLAVIATARDMLDRYYDRYDEEKRREKLDSIGRQLRYVLDLLDDVSLIVKGNLNHSIFKPAPVNLPSLCQASLRAVAETSGAYHQLAFSSDGTIVTGIVDETLVSRILINLISNAVKFSPIESTILLELSGTPTSVTLRVHDEGMGIAPEDLAHIFEPFYRSDSVRDIIGSGLGLSIVKDCVDRHGGRIDVESIVGQGTTFIVHLPSNGLTP